MALPLINISTSLVSTTIGEASNDVGALCKSTKVNKWSKRKPLRFDKITGLTVPEIESLGSGIVRVNDFTEPWLFDYLKPRGGAVDEPYRLGDFRGYNHLAGTPVQIQILSVESGMFSTQTEAPFVMVLGLNYTINFKLILAGEINPLTIDERTDRVKNTNALGGYGGLTWVTNPYTAWAVPVYRADDEVFTCPTVGELSQDITVLSNDVRMQYVKYKGDSDGRYEVLHGLWAEAEDVRDKFLVREINASLDFSSNTSLNIHYLSGVVYANLVATNNEEFDLYRTRVRIIYKTNGGSDLTGSTSDFISYHESSVGKQFTLTGWTGGQNNEFAVRAFYEMYNTAESTWIEIGYAQLTKTIYIPIPD